MKLVQLLREAQFHGSNRIAEKFGRPFWLVALSLLFLVAISVVNETVQRYLDNPTYITRIDGNHRTTVFPSVFLCPEVLFSQSKRDEFISTINLPEGINKTYLKNIIFQLSAFYSPDLVYNLEELQLIEKVLKLNNINEETAARQMSLTCEEAIIRCRWRGQMVNCTEIFSLELTEFGFCCIFNGRSLLREMKEWTENKRKIIYPERWRTTRVGYRTGLMFAVNQSEVDLVDVDTKYKWLVVQSGQHYADAISNGTPISPGVEVHAGYSNKGLRVSSTAKTLSDRQRRCKMQADRLKYFPLYTRMYCRVECLMEQIWRKCNCILLAHPQPRHVPRCNASQLSCARTGVSHGNCYCPGTCELGFEEIVLQNQQLRRRTHPFDNFYEGLDILKVTTVRVYILRHEGEIKSRRSYFTALDLFAQLGGMFNVFFGCSILTIFEIIQLFRYGIREKLSTKKRKFKRHKKKSVLDN